MTNQRLRSTLSALLFTLLMAGALIYILKMRPTVGPETDSGTPLFNVADVQNLTWQVGSQTFLYTRNKDVWAPAVEPARLDTKLYALAGFEYRPQAPTAPDSDLPSDTDNPPKVEITLQFKNGQVWRGYYAESSFYWTQGPYAKQEFELDPGESEIFEEGRYAFEPLNWNWCGSSTPRQISFELDDEGVMIEHGSEGWEITNLAGDAKIVDKTWVEKWVADSCPTALSAWIDFEHFPTTKDRFGLSDGSLEVIAPSGETTEFTIREMSFQIDEKKGGVSPAFRQTLEEVIAAP